MYLARCPRGRRREAPPDETLGERFGTPVSLIAIDIDHCKLLNDRDGHPTGDRFPTVLTDRRAGLEPGGTRSAMGGVRGPAAVLTPSIAGDDRPAPPAASSEAEVDVPADLAAARTDRPTIVVSLGGSAYFDSQGMHMLLRFNRRLETSRRQLVVVVPGTTR